MQQLTKTVPALRTTKRQSRVQSPIVIPIINGYYENIYDWEQALNVDQANLAEYQKAKDILVRYRDLVETQKDTTPYELGLFEEPSTIKVVLESTSDTALADYLAVLAHEYLHYTSYVSEERSLPQFFEEGLTE